MRIFRRLLTLPAARRQLLVRAGTELMRAAWVVRRRPFARIAAGLGPVHPVPSLHAQDTPEALSAVQRQLALDTAWAIAQWTRRWPWPPTCLMQALAAHRILNRAATPSRLYFGVRSSASAQPAASSTVGAHAWLCTGDLVVTGASEAAIHRPIALYRSPPAAQQRGDT